MFLAFAVVWSFFILQATFVLKEFKPEFVIVPSLLAMVIGAAIAKIAILKRKLAEQHDIFRSLTDFGQEFLYLRDPQGKYVYVSPYCKELTGYSPEDFYQNSEQMEALVHPDDLHLWKQHSDNMFHNHGESEFLVIRLVSKSGEIRWINHVCSRVFGYDGEFQGVRSSNIDITKREELERLKEQFLKRMSHEFRTPMNGILGCTDLLNAEIEEDSELKKYLDIIQMSGERLMQTLDNLLELTRLGNAQVNFHNASPVDLLAMTQHLLRLYEHRIRIEGKKLQLQYQHNVPEINVVLPASAMECILRNLLDNAVKFSHQGQIVIELCLQQDNLSIIIKDPGIGIEPHLLPYIFEEFTQGSQGDTRNFDGTGIGLSLVKKLVTGMQGSIQVLSEPKQGTTAILSVPCPPKEARESVR